MLNALTPKPKPVRGVSEDTEVLTTQGFMKVTEVTQETTLLQYHENGTLSFTKPCAPIDTVQYNNLALSITTKRNKINQLIAVEQRIPYIHQNTHGEYVFKTTSLKDGVPLISTGGFKNKYPLGGKLISQDDKTLTPLEKLKLLPTSRFVYIRQTTQQHHVVHIRLFFKAQAEYVIGLLTEAQIPIVHYELNKPDEYLKRDSILLVVHLPKHIYTKDFSWIDLGAINYTWCRDFIETLLCLTASNHQEFIVKYNDQKEYVYKKNHRYVADKKSADIIQAIGYMAGYRVFNHFINGGRTYKLFFTEKDYTVMTETTIARPIEYSGLMVHIRVPSALLVIRRNNITSITGG